MHEILGRLLELDADDPGGCGEDSAGFEQLHRLLDLRSAQRFERMAVLDAGDRFDAIQNFERNVGQGWHSFLARKYCCRTQVRRRPAGPLARGASSQYSQERSAAPRTSV